MHTLPIFLVAFFGLSSAWLICPPGQRYKQFDRVVYDPNPRTESWEECVPEASYNDPNVAIDGERYESGHSSGSINAQAQVQFIQCPAGTIKKTYQHSVRHHTDIPQTYERCDPEGPMNTNQNPAMSPSGQNWNDWNSQASGSVAPMHTGVPCPEGYTKVQIQQPISYPGEIPQVVVRCHPNYNDKNGPNHAPNGGTWGLYSG